MSEAVDTHNMLMHLSTSYRLAHSGVVIDGVVPLDFGRFPFIPEIIDNESELTTIIKGAQMGFTIACIMKVLEKAKHEKLRGIGYFFPSEGEVGDFARARFGPMMTNNWDIWGRHVKDTDSNALKRINDTFLYFRGMGQKGSGAAKRSTSKQKSIPLDGIVLDERDEMDDTKVDAIEHRLDGSLNPWRIDLSTPTLPGYGVDFQYSLSDQRVWMWKCEHCNEWQCLDLTYPDCIAEPTNADPYFICTRTRCRRELGRVSGEWVARQPNIKGHAGFWVSQLSSPTVSAAKVLLAILQSERTGRRREFENQVLARAFAEADEEITAEMLELLLTNEPRPLRHSGPCAMGVDPGKPHWYEVKLRLTEEDTLVLARGRASSYEELDRISQAYNVESGVMDQGYDPTAVQAFVRSHPGWYGCLYVGGKKTGPDWDHPERVVKVGRTWLLDLAHREILARRVKHVRKDEFWTECYVPQMTNLKRATIEKDKTGEREGEWVITGGRKNDHLRHADAYASLAATRVGLSKAVMELRSRSMEETRASEAPSGWSL